MTTTGVFTLSSPRDLFDKLCHDVEVIKKNRTDPYAAYNFVVTAEHMLDWIHPGDTNRKTRNDRRDAEPLLALISHLANGAKHFTLLRDHHKSVEDRGSEILHAPTFLSATRGSRMIIPPISDLIVHLEGKAEAKYGSYIRVVKLATDTCDYWSRYFSVQPNTNAP